MRLAVVILFSICAWGQHWDTFKPESVTSYGCSIQQVDLRVSGADSVPKWDFTAWAKRDLAPPEDEWRMTIGMYPPTAKGREEAMKECNKWMTEAEKRMSAVRDSAQPSD